MTKASSSSSKQYRVNLNILPDRHRKSGLSLLVVLAFLLWAVLLGLTYPAGKNYLEVQQAFSQNRAELNRLQAEAENYQPLTDRLEEVRQQIQAAEEEAAQIRSRYQEIQFDSTRWSERLSSILDTVPQGVQLQEINQSGSVVEINGTAASYQRVLLLAENLHEQGGFPQVQIDSIIFISEEQIQEDDANLADLPSTPSYLYQMSLTAGEGGVQR